jgi:hypothetical protein
VETSLYKIGENMSLFKRKKSGEDIFKGILVKSAYLEMDHNNIGIWNKQISEYMADAFPYLSAGLRDTQFRAIDEDSGSAVGYTVWEDNGISMVIPIIIEDYKLKEPNLAKYKDKIIPLDENYISMIRTTDGQVGEIDKPDEDMNIDLDYISQGGLFSLEDGHVKVSALKETLDRLKDVYARENIKISDKIDKYIKTGSASNIRPSDPILAASFTELEDRPYHYNAEILKRASDGRLYHETKNGIGAAEMKRISGLNKIAEVDGEDVEWVTLEKDKSIKNAPVLKKITDTGEYDVIMDGDLVSCYVVSNLISIWEGKPSSEAIAVEKDTDSGRRWIYGNVFGSQPEPSNYGRPELMTMPLVKVEDNQDAMGKIIIIKLGNDITVPYKVIQCQNVKMGANGEDVESYRMESLHDGTRAVIWLHKNVQEILKADKKKLKEYGYTIWGDDEVYIIPATAKIFQLNAQDRRESNDIRGGYEKYVKKIASNYDTTMEIIKTDYNDYVINVSGSENKNYSGLNKEAALLIANHYTGSDHKNIGDYNYFMEYPILKRASDSKKTNKPADITPLNKYRNEWIKTASILSSLPQAIKKHADVEGIVNDLVGIEITDESNVGDINKIISLVERLVSQVGELLLLARMGKTELPEDVLAKSFKALTELCIALHGKNEYTD